MSIALIVCMCATYVQSRRSPPSSPCAIFWRTCKNRNTLNGTPFLFIGVWRKSAHTRECAYEKSTHTHAIESMLIARQLRRAQFTSASAEIVFLIRLYLLRPNLCVCILFEHIFLCWRTTDLFARCVVFSACVCVPMCHIRQNIIFSYFCLFRFSRFRFP